MDLSELDGMLEGRMWSSNEAHHSCHQQFLVCNPLEKKVQLTLTPSVLGRGEFRNSSVNLIQLSALLKSEWTISFS